MMNGDQVNANRVAFVSPLGAAVVAAIVI